MSMKIITGKTGTPHVDSSDDAALYRAIIGVDYVLPNGSKFSYEVIDNNTIKINDGDILIQGHLGRIVPGDYENVTINNGTQGMKRNDLIVARYTKNTETGFENMELAVVEGIPGATATDPSLTVEDLTNGGTTREVALYRVSLDGLSIKEVTFLAKVSSSLAELTNEISKNTNGWWKDKKTGFILQWGDFLTPGINANADITPTITLPVSFPTRMLLAMPYVRKCVNASGGTVYVETSIKEVTLYTASTFALRINAKAYIEGGVILGYIAIGY